MDIELIVKTAVADNLFLDLNQIENYHSFIDDYDVDSLDLTEITMELESRLNIQISLNYLNEHLKTVQDLIDLTNRIYSGEELKINKESGCGRYGNLIKETK